MASKRTRLLLEPLERRVCLAVSASVVNGSLLVTGEPNGAVQINATAANTYQVIDNGVLIGTFAGVTRNIRVNIDSTAPRSNDNVTLNLGGFATPLSVRLDAGDGNNTFTIQNGTVTRSLIVVGGSGNDMLLVQSNATVTRHLIFLGYSGADTLTFRGTIGGNLIYRAGGGADTFTFDEPATALGRVVMYGSRGSDTVTLLGQSRGNIMVDLSGGNDTLSSDALFETTGTVLFQFGPGDDTATLDGWYTGSVSVELGNGDDTVDFDGRFSSTLEVDGGLGDDTFGFDEDAVFEDDVTLFARRGDDTGTFEGYFADQVFANFGPDDDTVNLANTAYFEDDLFLRLSRGHDLVQSSAIVDGLFDIAGGTGIDTLTLSDGYYGAFLVRGFDNGSGGVIRLDPTQIDFLDTLVSSPVFIPVAGGGLVVQDLLTQQATSIQLADGTAFPVLVEDLVDVLTDETIQELLTVPAGTTVVLTDAEVEAAAALLGTPLLPAPSGGVGAEAPGNELDPLGRFKLQDLALAHLTATMNRQLLLAGTSPGLGGATTLSNLEAVLARMLLQSPFAATSGIQSLS